MKLREDTTYLEQMVEHKVLTLPDAKEYSALPLVLVELAKEDSSEEVQIEYSNFVDDFSKKSTLFEYIPFIEMVGFIGYRSDWKNDLSKNISGLALPFYFKIKKIDCITLEFSLTTSPKFLFTCKITQMKEEKKYFFENIKLIPGKTKPSNYDIIKPLMIEECFVKNNYPSMIIKALMAFITFNEENDRYAIGVKENSNNKNGSALKVQLAKIVGPRIIYLDKLPDPIDQTPESIGFGSPKAPHQRRGTWVTLRAERFRNHPMGRSYNDQTTLDPFLLSLCYHRSVEEYSCISVQAFS